jgi:hypothetical protein
MKLGILADIHEAEDELRWALGVLKDQGVDRLVFLGDLCERLIRLEECVAILEEARVTGVWGNHDFGLCRDNPTPHDRQRFGERVLGFMGQLQARLEIDGCLFTHVEPWLDPEKIEDLWYFEGPPVTPEQFARIFGANGHPVMFVGHYHRWLHVTEGGIAPWTGDTPIVLDPDRRHLVVIDAVFSGKCARFDTETRLLTPLDRSRPG